MMKLLLHSIAYLTLTIVILSCGAKREANEGDESKEWKEMDDFHIVMAETFHPFKDSADLGPIKSKSGELVKSAELWATAPIPNRVDNDEMKTSLQQLRSEAEVLRDLVQTGDDQSIGQQLEKVHDLFHAIQEQWYGAGDEHHHEH